MKTNRQILEALREALAWELTDEQFPYRRQAYELLKHVSVNEPKTEKKRKRTKNLPTTDPNSVVWQPMYTVPRGIPVEVLSRHGLVRKVTVHENQKIRDDGNLYCWGPVGSIVATKWRRI